MVYHDLVNRSQIRIDHYNPLLVYSIHSCLTLYQTLIVNLIYWFAQSVPTFLGSTTQPSPIPRILYLAKPRPYLGLHPYEAVYNILTNTLKGLNLNRLTCLWDKHSHWSWYRLRLNKEIELRGEIISILRSNHSSIFWILKPRCLRCLGRGESNLL